MAISPRDAFNKKDFFLNWSGREPRTLPRTLCEAGVLSSLMAMLVPAPGSVAGQITCTGCPPPNRPVCTDKCVFLSPADYALNGVQLMLQNPEILTRVANEARRRVGLTFPGAGDNWPEAGGNYRWWSDWIGLSDVQQITELDSPALKKTVVKNTIRTPTLFSNCGIGEKVYSRNDSDQIKEQLKREHEEIEKSIQQNEMTVRVEASYEKVISASAQQKMTSSIERTRRDYIMRNEEIQTSHALSDQIKVPERSIADASVTETNSSDIYEVHGVMTTDAAINAFFGLAWHQAAIGQWSDYWPADKRQFPVTITFSIPSRIIEVSSTVNQFPDEKSCLDAAAKWRAAALKGATQ